MLAMRGAAPHLFSTLEEELSLAIFQTAFDPAAVEGRLEDVRQAAHERREKLLRDARMLERVASYSETGEDQEQTQQHADVFARRLAERAAKKDE
jgi:hypothetical protein